MTRIIFNNGHCPPFRWKVDEHSANFSVFAKNTFGGLKARVKKYLAEDKETQCWCGDADIGSINGFESWHGSVLGS